MTDPRYENRKTYFLAQQQDQIRLKIEDGNLILVQADSYGEEQRIFVNCTVAHDFVDGLQWALKNYARGHRQKVSGGASAEPPDDAPPTQPSDETEPPPKRSSDPTAAERMRRYRARKAEAVTEATVTESTETVTEEEAN
jgi:hypothetical protein